MGSQLKELRKAHNMTQQQLADLCDMERVSVCNVESGVHGLTSTNLYVISCVFDVPVDHFFPDRSKAVIKTQKVRTVKIVESIRLKPVKI